jgi:amino-acid N-acetyltransferase
VKLSAAIRAASGADMPVILALLAEAGLDAEGLDAPTTTVLVAETAQFLAGTIALELHGRTGLLRSAAVRPELRGRRIGEQLTGALLTRARAMRLRDVVLLTTTAAGFFERMGFAVAERSTLGGSILRSQQFQGGCPATALCMRIALE